MKKILSPIGVVSCCLVFSAVHSQVKAQTRIVTGQVNNGEKPISGATVTQEGTNQVTTTSPSGTFSLQITGENPVLIFRHTEYSEKKIKTDGKSTFNVSLTEKVKVIEEVVLNAGYYKVKAKESTGSIAKVTAKDIENQPVNNVLSAVQGRMAGVNITQNGGVPGGGYQVQIRGRNSLRTISNSGIDGNLPLYVVDNVVIGGETTTKYAGTALPYGSINPLNSINPNDIESIEILKDADATAIYGSRGANGVILITTKKGKAGKISLSVTTNYSLSTAITNLKMLNTEQYLDMRRQAFVNDGVVTYPANAYDVNGTWDKNRYTNWPEKLVGNTATSSDIRASIGGGNEQTKFLISLVKNEQNTPFGNDFKYVSNTLSNNLSHRSKDNKLEINVSNIFTMSKNNVVNNDITWQSFTLSPNAPDLYLENGSINWAGGTFTNPIAAFQSRYTNDSRQWLTNISSSYELFKNVKIKINGGLGSQYFEEWSFKPNTMYSPFTALGLSSATSKVDKYNRSSFSFMWEPQVMWDFQKTRHHLNAILGSTIQQDTHNVGSMSGAGFESNAFISNIAAANTKTIGDQLTTEYRYAAVFARINYQFDKKYIVNITGRRDGSSRFGLNNRFSNFGALGAAWIFTKENWLKDLSWISFGKIRSSYGLTGSDNIGDYQYNDTYTVSPLIYNNVTGLVPSRLFNPDYSWEKTYKLEAAVELGLFKNHLNLTASWYRNRSSNQLVGYQLPAITGFTSVLANLSAEVENKGVELEITAYPFKESNLKWETSFNVSFPKNKLLSFPGLEGSTYSNSYIIGMPVTIVKLYNLEGIDPQTGKYIFTDYNEDGKISAPDDNKVIENLGVRSFGGWSNRLSYQNWEFSFLFQFVQQKSRNYNYSMPSPGLMVNLPVQALNAWSVDNPNGIYMPYQATGNPSHFYFQNSSVSVSDASFIRLKNIQLGYNIPLKNTLVRSARVYMQGQNLLTWTKYFGHDPEDSSTGFLPPLKTYSFGIQCNF